MIATAPETITPQEALALLDVELDLSGVRLKLAHPDDADGLTEDELDIIEPEYRKFLALQLLHPEAAIVPCKPVDEMWHRHILDTAAYREDCERIFGRFLDHFPYFGMRGEGDAQALADAYASTLEHYRSAFGEPPAHTWLAADASSCRRTACKPQKCR